MKKNNIIIVGIFLLVILILGAILLKGGAKDKWICKNGQWIRQGSPKVSQPRTPCQGARMGQELPEIPPDSTVVSFYSWLIKNTDAISTGSYKTSPYLADSYKQKIPQLISSAQSSTYNPFVCSDEQLKSYKMSKSSVKDHTGLVNVEATFGTGEKPILVQLQTQGKSWKIQNITCP